MKKIKTYKGFVIAQNKEFLFIYTKDEWNYGHGCRYWEHEACSMQEAIDFIDSY